MQINTSEQYPTTTNHPIFPGIRIIYQRPTFPFNRIKIQIDRQRQNCIPYYDDGSQCQRLRTINRPIPPST